jgi:hypothetical protein
MRAFKVFNSDWSCNGYSFATKSGNFSKKVFAQKGELELCSNGFHFCRKLANCFDYYSFDSDNRVAEIEVIGDYIGDKDDKECTDKFKIVRELSWHDVLELVNTGKGCSGNRNSGNRNSGNWNSGNRNSGNWNSGNRNSGNWNSGNWNSGNWNSGDWNSGYMNTNKPDKIRVFNKFTKNKEIDFPNFLYFELTKFISHDSATEQERIDHKQDIETCGGFLKTLEYKEAWKLSYDKASKEDKAKVKKIPGFDKDLFFEISGIMVD